LNNTETDTNVAYARGRRVPALVDNATHLGDQVTFTVTTTNPAPTSQPGARSADGCRSGRLHQRQCDAGTLGDQWLVADRHAAAAGSATLLSSRE
jgi:hypothetical protein